MKCPITIKKSSHLTQLDGINWDYYFYYEIDKELDEKILTIFEKYFTIEKTEENLANMQEEINSVFEEWSKE